MACIQLSIFKEADFDLNIFPCINKSVALTKQSDFKKAVSLYEGRVWYFKKELENCVMMRNAHRVLDNISLT